MRRTASLFLVATLSAHGQSTSAASTEDTLKRSRVMRRLVEISPELDVWLNDKRSHSDKVVDRAIEVRSASNPNANSKTVLIVILVVVLVSAIPLLWFCGRMFWRLWKHPRAVHYIGAATADEDDLVQVKPNGPTSMNGRPGYGGGGLDLPTFQVSEDGSDPRISTYSHPSITVISPTEDEHASFLHEAILANSPPPPPIIPAQYNESPTKSSSPGIARKPPPSVMNDEMPFVMSRVGDSRARPGSASFAPPSPSQTPIIRAPVPVRAEQPPMPRVYSPPSIVQTSPPPGVRISSSSPSSAAPPRSRLSSPPREYYNPYRDPSFEHQQRPISYPSSVPDPIAPPPLPPALLINQSSSPSSARLSSSNFNTTTTTTSTSTSPTSPRATSPTSPNVRGGPRPMPRGARPRSQVTSMMSTMSVVSDSTTSQEMMGMAPLRARA